MRTFRETLLEGPVKPRVNPFHPAYLWAADRIEKTKDDIDTVRDAFHKEFKGKHKRHLEKAINDVAGY